MGEDTTDFERLSQLLDEGRITKEEYEALTARRSDLRARSIDSLGENGLPNTPNGRAARKHTTGGNQNPLSPQDSESTGIPPGSRDRSAGTTEAHSFLYPASLTLGVASVFFGGLIGILAWATIAVSVWALAAAKQGARRWMAWTGLVLGLVYSLLNAYNYGHLESLERALNAQGSNAPTVQAQDTNQSRTTVRQTTPTQATTTSTVSVGIEEWREAVYATFWNLEAPTWMNYLSNEELVSPFEIACTHHRLGTPLEDAVALFMTNYQRDYSSFQVAEVDYEMAEHAFTVAAEYCKG